MAKPYAILSSETKKNAQRNSGKDTTMRLKRLAPERLEIAHEEYAKLVNPVVKELLGEYCSFEWVMYRVTEPTEFWKRDLSADVVRQKLNRAIFYVLRDMLCESFVNYYGPTTGPTETSRVAQWASLEASHILHKPDEVDAQTFPGLNSSRRWRTNSDIFSAGILEPLIPINGRTGPH